jgi:hypothetical protein
MFFPVPKQTAPCLTLLVHSNESGRRFDMDTCAVPPCGHRARSPFSSLPVWRRARSLREGAPTFVLEKRPSC